MADLIIRGMEMPQWCSDCVCNSMHYCNALKRDVSDFLMTNKFPEECPLIEIQANARLIDANMVVLAKFCGDREGRYTEYERGWNDALDVIKKRAPSIFRQETKPAEAQTPELQACPYCEQKPTIRKWGRIYRAECEQYACKNPYAANGRTPEDCAECWNTFVSQIQADMEREEVKPDDQ